MSLLELISDAEQAMIFHQIERYAMTNDSYSDMHGWQMGHVFREWERAKGLHLSDLFGDNLILRRPVEFAKDVDELAGELENVAYPTCLRSLMKMFDETACQLDPDYVHRIPQIEIPACLKTLDSEAAWAIRKCIDTMTALEVLAANSFPGPTIEIPLPSGKKLKVNHGCRVVKMLGKLVEAFGFDTEEFEEFRIAHSQTLNQKKLKGTLCISIHPLDYITMSDNACGWDSCMSWENHGCYRQGTVEMLNSPNVIVAYLESDTPMRIGRDYTWTNKKWRELYIVDKNIITNVKGYPYCNSNLTEEVLTWLRDLVCETHTFGDIEYRPKIYHWGRWNSDYDELHKLEIGIECHTNNMYNDFGHQYQYCLINSELPCGSFIEIDYSGEPECMVCGALDPSFINDGEAANLACSHCDDYAVCACCGNNVSNGEYSYVNDDLVCDWCREEYYVRDMVNDELVHQDEVIEIHLCNEDHTLYVDDWELDVVTWEGTNTKLLTTKEVFNIPTKGFWKCDRYFIEIGTWTEDYLDAISYNIGGCNEEKLRKILEEVEWREI